MDIKTVDKNCNCMRKQKKGHRIIGVLLSGIGLFWLARKAGWMSYDTSWVPHHANGSTMFWPLVLIAVGLLLIFRLGGRGKDHSKRLS